MRGRRRAAIAGVLVALTTSGPALAAGTDPLRDAQWALDRIRAGEAQVVATGRGQVVAVIDSGADRAHPDLALAEGRDFVDGGPMTDGAGHGTHVAGVIAARTGNGVGVASVAPGARIMPLRVLDDRGDGDLRQVAQAIDHAVANGAEVINISLSPNLPLESIPVLDVLLERLGLASGVNSAIARALDAGVVVVAAAGNQSLPLCSLPAARGRVLCVGAVSRGGRRAAFSNFGLGVGLVAPGVDVISTLPGGAYGTLSGTSQAAPHVAGVAALLGELGLSGQAAVQRIAASAEDLGPAGADAEYGAGEVDAAAAVAGLPPALRDAFTARSGQRFAVVRHRRGILVDAVARSSGTLAIRVTSGRRVIAKASRAVEAGTPVSVRVPLTAAGRRAIPKGRREPLRTRVAVTFPGQDAPRTAVVRLVRG